MYALHWPNRIQFGPGAAQQLVSLLDNAEGPCWILADRALAGRVEDLMTQVRRGASVNMTVVDTVDPDWTVVERLRQEQPEGLALLAGVGGGSTLDVAKAIATVPRNLGWDDVRGVDRVPGPRSCTLVLVPSTAGTGSEVSPSVVLAERPGGEKAAATSRWLVADVALVDPELVVTAPTRVLIDSGIDAMSHAVEAYLGRGHNTVSDALALSAAGALGRWLPALCRSPSLESAEPVAEASLQAGMAFSVAGLGAIHGLGYALSHRYRLSHGRANALLLGPVTRFNSEIVGDRVQHLAAQLPGSAPGAERLTSWVESLGVSCRLTDYGAAFEDLEELTEAGYRTGHRLFANNARPLTSDDVQTIYREVLEGR